MSQNSTYNYTNLNIHFDFPVRERVVFGSALCLIIVITLADNLFMWVAILRIKNLRTASNLLVLSLSFTDLLMATTIMPATAYNHFLGRQGLSKPLCQAAGMFYNLCVLSTILTLTVLTIHHYIRICHSRKYKYCGRKGGAVSVAGVWLLSGLYIAPLFPGWYDTEDATVKMLCNGLCTSTLLVCVLKYTLMVGVPFLLTAFCYWRIVVLFRSTKKRVKAAEACHHCTSLSVNPATQGRTCFKRTEEGRDDNDNHGDDKDQEDTCVDGKENVSCPHRSSLSVNPATQRHTCFRRTGEGGDNDNHDDNEDQEGTCESVDKLENASSKCQILPMTSTLQESTSSAKPDTEEEPDTEEGMSSAKTDTKDWTLTESETGLSKSLAKPCDQVMISLETSGGLKSPKTTGTSETHEAPLQTSSADIATDSEQMATEITLLVENKEETRICSCHEDPANQENENDVSAESEELKGLDRPRSENTSRESQRRSVHFQKTNTFVRRKFCVYRVCVPTKRKSKAKKGVEMVFCPVMSVKHVTWWEEEIKMAASVGMIVAAFIISYFPILIASFARYAGAAISDGHMHFLFLILCANSFYAPIIYGAKNRCITNAYSWLWKDIKRVVCILQSNSIRPRKPTALPPIEDTLEDSDDVLSSESF